MTTTATKLEVLPQLSCIAEPIAELNSRAVPAYNLLMLNLFGLEWSCVQICRRHGLLFFVQPLSCMYDNAGSLRT